MDISIFINLAKCRDALDSEVRYLAKHFTWKELADSGYRCEAVKRYRDENKDSLANSVKAVDSYIGDMSDTGHA